MSPHGTKGSSKKAMSKSVSMIHNGPRMSSKKKRKLANENSDPEVLDRSAKYWHAIKMDSINEKILKHLSAPSRRYKLKDEESVLPAQKKRKLQKNGGLETDSDDEKNSKKERFEMKKKLQSKLRKLKRQNLDSELAAVSGVKNKSKKSLYGNACAKGKKSRQKLLSANYEDLDGVCIYELDVPELKNKSRKKLMAERAKGANHLLNKKKVRVGKGVLTPKNLTKKQKPTIRIDAAKFKVLSKSQQNKIYRKYSVQLVSDAEGSDSDSSPDKDVSGSSCKKSLAKITRLRWADLNKKAAKLKMQELELPKSKKFKRQQVSEEDEDDSEDDDDDDLSSEEEDLSDDDMLEEEEEEDDDDDEDEDDEEDDDDDSSEEHTNDEKSRQGLKLSNRVWVERYEDRALVIIQHPFECHLLGSMQLCVIAGCINILGAKLTTNATMHPVYSPTSHMLLKLTTEQPIGKGVSKIMNYLSFMFPYTDHYVDHINPNVVILLVSSLNCGFTDWITTINPYQNLFNAYPKAYKIPYNKHLKPFGISLLKRPSMVTTSASSSEMDEFFRKWPSILENSDCPKMLLCGGKNVGKSTVARTLINMALETKKAVCFLDCDPGQTEFTPPGCVSLNVVKKFVFGPPFCHQEDPEFNIFIGEVSPENNSNHYMMCIRSAMEYYLRMPEQFPLIINTMGWVTGPGKKMLDGIINLTSPDHIVLLKHNRYRIKYSDLIPSTIAKNQWNFYGETAEQLVPSLCEWKVTVLRSVVKDIVKVKSKLSNPELRTLSILSYLAKTCSLRVSLSHNIPYKIQWNSLAIYICHEIVPPNQILYAINASVVALCNADMTQTSHLKGDENLPRVFKKRPICKCLGFGFVRGIQVETQMLYIVSPLPMDVISEVNTLMRGSITLPLETLQTQNSRDLKYVDNTIEAS